MTNDRLREKNDLFMKLGVLFGPLLRIAEHPEGYDDQEKAEAVAQYCHDAPQLVGAFARFAGGQPGHLYAVESQRFSSAIYGVQNGLVGGSGFASIVRDNFARARGALDAVPLPRTSEILEAGTPFETYRRLRELSEVDATKSVMWLDPYIDYTIFHRYLAGVRPDASITLVTEEPDASRRKERRRWEEFLDVSRLFAQERGPDRYQLRVAESLHDRWVIFDERRIYALGGSAKDAGSRDHFTLTTVDASQPNLDRIKAIMGGAKELFGPSFPTHA